MIDNPRPGERVTLRFYYNGDQFEWLEGEIVTPCIGTQGQGAIVRINRGDMFIYFSNLFTVDEGLRLALEDAAK